MSAPLGSRTTAEDVLALQPTEEISGKVIIVTGGNTWIGLETVRTLANAGAHVMVSSRNVKSGKKALESIKTPGHEGERAFILEKSRIFVLNTEQRNQIQELNLPCVYGAK